MFGTVKFLWDQISQFIGILGSMITTKGEPTYLVTTLLSGPPQTFVLPLSRMIKSNADSPALLSSSPFLPVCLMQTILFFVILFFFLIHKVTSFVVTRVNKSTVITLLC